MTIVEHEADFVIFKTEVLQMPSGIEVNMGCLCLPCYAKGKNVAHKELKFSNEEDIVPTNYDQS